MVLMENGNMDAKCELSSDSDRFIMISGKGIKNACFKDDPTVPIQNADGCKSTATTKQAPVLENNNYTNCEESTTNDSSNNSEIRCIVNGDNSSFNHQSCARNIVKTNSSQSCTNSQDLCCKNLESELSSLNITNQESANVISSETTTNQRITEEMNGAPNEISSTDVADVDSLNTSCSIEKGSDDASEIAYISYESENQMPDIMKLIQKDLSEPYSIYTYRYFIHNWPHLCFLAVSNGKSVGAIVCKLDLHRKIIKRGYIAMLAVDEYFRKKGIGSNLVLKAIRVMATEGADEVVLETEITNQPALRLYENLGFVRDKRLFRYYLNGVDALRLKLWLR